MFKKSAILLLMVFFVSNISSVENSGEREFTFCFGVTVSCLTSISCGALAVTEIFTRGPNDQFKLYSLCCAKSLAILYYFRSRYRNNTQA